MKNLYIIWTHNFFYKRISSCSRFGLGPLLDFCRSREKAKGKEFIVSAHSLSSLRFSPHHSSSSSLFSRTYPIWKEFSLLRGERERWVLSCPISIWWGSAGKRDVLCVSFVCTLIVVDDEIWFNFVPLLSPRPTTGSPRPIKPESQRRRSVWVHSMFVRKDRKLAFRIDTHHTGRRGERIKSSSLNKTLIYGDFSWRYNFMIGQERMRLRIKLINLNMGSPYTQTSRSGGIN